MSISMRRPALSLATVALAAVAFTAPVSAGGSIKDAPADEGRKFTWSFNVAGTSDYVYRGVSQNMEDPALQVGIDVGYGIFYAGFFGSNVDFVAGSGGFASGDATWEATYYGGIKPTWGPLTFDLGVIYYTYPGAPDQAAELDFLEIKGGISGSIQKLSLSGIVYYSPEYTAETGQTWTLEGIAGYELPAFGPFTPTISGTIGTTLFDDDSTLDYVYWNAGIAFAIDKLTLDFRYWDTNSDGADFCANAGLCDERFVFTAKVTLP